MKKTLIIILVLVVYFQHTIAQQPKYLPNPNINKFVGTWVYQAGNNRITLFLLKSIESNSRFSSDWITGYYTYTKEGKIIPNNQEKTIKLGSTISENGVNHADKLYFILYDSIKKKGGKVTLELVPGKTDEAEWFLSNPVAARMQRKGEEKHFDESFTLPTHLLFKKQQ
jgi:hypothetical protein